MYILIQIIFCFIEALPYTQRHHRHSSDDEILNFDDSINTEITARGIEGADIYCHYAIHEVFEVKETRKALLIFRIILNMTENLQESQGLPLTSRSDFSISLKSTTRTKHMSHISALGNY